MNRFTTTMAFLILLPLTVSGQNADHPHRVDAYAFAAYDPTVGPFGGVELRKWDY